MSENNIAGMIHSLKQYIASFPNEEMPVILHNGERSVAICDWYDPLPDHAISEFLDRHQWTVPDDYRAFLQLHNGATLFQHPYFGGGIRLLSTSVIEQLLREVENIPPHYMPIAYTSYLPGSICIDTNKLRQDKMPYLYFLDAIELPEAAIPINTTFYTWLERLIMCQGMEYWVWDHNDRIDHRSKM